MDPAYPHLYASMGWPVLPLRGKIATLTPQGVLDASTDHAVIDAWWRRWPRANVGVRCSECLVLDVDSYHGGDVEVRQATEQHGRLPEGPIARTGGGGWHVLLAPLPLATGEERRRHPFRGTELCGPGHYIVAPPSVHPETGALYRWVRPPSLALPSVPAWLRALFVRPPAPLPPPLPPTSSEHSRRRAAAWLARVEGAVSGQHGHDATFRVACRLLGFGISPAEALALMSQWNQTCSPPWRERELARKVAEAERAVRQESPCSHTSP